MAGLLRRLKQRKLVQWALAYIAAAFALIQVLDVVASRFDWPTQLERIIILALAVGFVVTLVIAWYHGEKGRQRASGAELLLIALVLAIGGALVWQFGRVSRSPDAAQRKPGSAIPDFAAGAAASGLRDADAPATQAAPISAKSIAVLPLSNESGEKDQQYFSDGLSEDLINAFSQFAGLKVISRNSAFQFRDSKLSSAAIGQALGVAHLLEGSVQKLGDQVRISAELVNAADGSTLWSQHYDRPYKDLFALQDDITKSVADALRAKLLDTNGAVLQSDRPPSGNLAAWNAYLKGQALYQRAGEADLPKAVAQFAEAARLDPDYAAAYSAEASASIRLAAYYLGSEAQRHAYGEARAAIDQALQLDPDLAAGHDARGLLLQWADFDWSGAEAEYRRALQLAPNDGSAKLGLAILLGDFGHPRQAIALLRQVLATDPHNRLASYLLAWDLAAIGELAEAEQVERKAIGLDPDAPDAHAVLALIQSMRGEDNAALASARQESTTGRDFALTVALQANGDHAAADAVLQRLIAQYADAQAYQIAQVYAFRRDPDNMFKWLDRAWANRDSGLGQLLSDPLILRYQNDPRFAAFCKKVGLPTTTDAKALP